MLLGLHVDADEKAAAVARHGNPDLPHISTHVAQVADTREEAVKTLMTEMPRWLAPGLDGYVAVDDRPRPSPTPSATPAACATSIRSAHRTTAPNPSWPRPSKPASNT